MFGGSESTQNPIKYETIKRVINNERELTYFLFLLAEYKSVSQFLVMCLSLKGLHRLSGPFITRHVKIYLIITSYTTMHPHLSMSPHNLSYFDINISYPITMTRVRYLLGGLPSSPIHISDAY